MKILIVNVYHYLRGGDCRHAFGLAGLLKNNGHDVHFFAMKSGQNLPCPDEKYFVSEIDFREAIARKHPVNIFKVVSRSIYSSESRKNIAKLLDDIKPDIVHLHSIRHHLTKSILPELAKRNIPIVWTLHDYKELCPNTSFYDGNGICEDCKGKKYFNVIIKRCKKGSFPASVVTWLEAVVNNCLNFDRYVNLVISPSHFLRDKFIEYGYEPDTVITIPNFLETDNFQPIYAHKNYLLYLGRLEREKGIFTLIDAFSKASPAMPDMSLKIAGTGSLEDELAQNISNRALGNVHLLGYKQGKELEELTRNAMAIVIPSEWYENYPFSCLEAMAYGKPVIASRIGGLPEQVEDGVTGLLFEAFNADDLAEKIQALARMPEEQRAEMGRKAREKVEKVNNPQAYLDRILAVYDRMV